MKARQKRLVLVMAGMAVLGLAVFLIVKAFKDNINYSYSPSEISAGKAPQDHTVRVGGLVEAGTLKNVPDTSIWTFTVTDLVHKVPVTYQGPLPDLFKEGKGVVAEGKLHGTEFKAEQVLAKHDENYMPPEAAVALKKAQEAKAVEAKAGATATMPSPDAIQSAKGGAQ